MSCQVEYNSEQSANILGETELTCSWIVVVTKTNYFVAFSNRAEDAVSAGNACHFFVSVHCS